MAAVVAAEEDRPAAELDLNLANIAAVAALHGVVDLVAGGPEFRGEVVGPVGEDLHGVGLQLGAPIIEVIAELELGHLVAVGLGQVQALGVVIGDSRTVTVADVPVETGEILLIGGRIDGRRAAEVGNPVDRRCAVDDLIVDRLGEAGNDVRLP